MRYVSIFWSHFTWPNTTLSHELSSWHPLWKDSLTFPHHHSYIFCSKLPRCILTMISSWGEIIEKLRNYTVGPRISEGELSLVHGSQHPTLTGFDGKCLIKWLFFSNPGVDDSSYMWTGQNWPLTDSKLEHRSWRAAWGIFMRANALSAKRATLGETLHKFW